MPLPKPSKDEKRNDFISTKGIKEPTKQSLKFNYQVPIIESAFINDDFIITGTALNATITSNNHKFLGEELRKSADTLNGVPLLIDHRNEVDAIKGRVISGEYSEEESKVNFRAHVIDNTMKEMIKDGRIDSVSVGADVKEIEETDDGFFVPHGIKFRELSLVAVPADEGATFTVALQEAYETASEAKVIESYANAEEVKKAMAKFNKTTFKSEDEKAELRLKIINAGRKFKIDTTEFEKATSTQTEAKSNNIIINKSGGKIMSEDETKPEEKTKEESKDEGVTEEKLQSMITNAVEKAVEKAVKVKSADGDEDKEDTKTEDTKKADDAESTEDTEDTEEESNTEEKGKYKIVQGHGALKGGSFTLVRA